MIAAMAFEQQMLRARCVKALRQERTRPFNGALAVNPHRTGKLLSRIKIMEMRETSRV